MEQAGKTPLIPPYRTYSILSKWTTQEVLARRVRQAFEADLPLWWITSRIQSLSSAPHRVRYYLHRYRVLLVHTPRALVMLVSPLLTVTVLQDRSRDPRPRPLQYLRRTHLAPLTGIHHPLVLVCSPGTRTPLIRQPDTNLGFNPEKR